MDPNLRNFAIFINSSSSTIKSTEKSHCSIPFNGNLSSFDPGKVLKVAINQFQFTNSVYNIDNSNNKLTICAEFAQGRGYNAAYAATYGQQELNKRLWQTWDIVIPPGSYNTEQLASYLSEQRADFQPELNTGLNAVRNRVGYESISQTFAYALDAPFPQSYTYQNCFVGFGSNPFDESDTQYSKGVSTIDNSSKVVFQSADLLHMVQYGTDVETACTNIIHGPSLIDPQNDPEVVSGPGTLDHSMVYRGVHLIYTAATGPLLKMLGFFNIDTVPPPIIKGYCNNQGDETVASGYSLYFLANVLNTTQGTYPTTNVTYYTFDQSEENQLVSIPTYLVEPLQAVGHTYSYSDQLSRELFFLAKAKDVTNVAKGYVSYDPGLYVQGQGFNSPYPFITDVVTYTAFPAKFLELGFTGNTFTLEIDIPAGFADMDSYFATLRLVRGAPVRISNYDQPQPNNVTECLQGYYVQTMVENLNDTATVVIYSSTPYSNPGTFADNDPTYLLEVVTHTLSSVAEVDILGPATDPPDPVTYYAGYYYNLLLTYEPLGVVSSELKPNTLTNLEGLGEIHVHCSELKTEFFSSTTGSALAPSDVICVVPVTEPFGSKQAWSPPLALEAFLSNTNIVTLNFRLTDSDNRLLDFNGVDWSMVLKCEELDVSKTMVQEGLLNTPYQDQLNVLEGTGRHELKTRGRKLPYEFYDSDKKHKSNPLNQYYMR